MRKRWLALVVGVCLVCLTVGVTALILSGGSARSSFNLATERWLGAYEHAVSKFGLTRRDWQLGSVDDLVHGRGLPGLKDTPQPSLSSFEVVLAEALEAYHQLGDVEPVLLVHGSGAKCLVVLDRIGTTGKTCVVTLIFDDASGWRIMGSEER